MTPEQIIAEARKWLGTPFMHQASVKGVACDCLGLVRGVGEALGLLPENYMSDPRVKDYVKYGRHTFDDRLNQALLVFLDPVPLGEERIGDVYSMRFGPRRQHVALITDIGIIHAEYKAGKVVEHRLSDDWRNTIAGRYRFRT